MSQYPALEDFIAKGSIATISTAPVAVIKEVQAILGCTVDGLVGDQTLHAFAKWKADNNQGQPTILGAGSAKLLLEYASKPKGETYLKLTKTVSYDNNGLRVLVLDYIKDGQLTDSLYCISGAAGAQKFRKAANSRSGSYEPLPQAEWVIKDIAWADGRDNYDGAVWSDALGPVSIPLECKEWTERAAIECHLDHNADYAPGTAGCIGIKSVADYRKLVSWLRESDIRKLVVDWGL